MQAELGQTEGSQSRQNQASRIDTTNGSRYNSDAPQTNDIGAKLSEQKTELLTEAANSNKRRSVRVKVDVGSPIQAQAQAKPRMRRQMSVIAEKYRKARQFGYVWFHAKVLPRMSPKAQNFI